MAATPRSTSDERRRTILDAATDVFLAKGFAGASMDDVVASAHASKQTLYRYFGDKEGLFCAVIDANIADAESGTQQLLVELENTTNLSGDLRRFARRHLRDVMQPHLMKIRRLVIAEADRFPSLARTWFERGPERAHVALQALFSHLAARGALRIDHPGRAAQHFNWLVLSIPLHRALYLPDEALQERELDEIADEAVRIFLAAYATA